MQKKVPILETERLVLQGIMPEDTKDIVKWRSNPKVYQYFLHPHVLSEKEHLLWYEKNYLVDINRIDWMCHLKDKDEKIGVFGIKRDSAQQSKAEISYLLSQQYQNKGFGREAITQIIQWCKQNGIIEITAMVHEKNQDSIKFIERMGFSKMAKDKSFMIYSLTVN